MSRIGRQLMLLTWALLACTLSGWGGVARRVLVIHSYEESYAAYPDFNRKIADAFVKGIWRWTYVYSIWIVSLI